MIISNTWTKKQPSAEVLYNLLNKLENNHLKSIFHEIFYKIHSKILILTARPHNLFKKYVFEAYLCVKDK